MSFPWSTDSVNANIREFFFWFSVFKEFWNHKLILTPDQNHVPSWNFQTWLTIDCTDQTRTYGTITLEIPFLGPYKEIVEKNEYLVIPFSYSFFDNKSFLK